MEKVYTVLTPQPDQEIDHVRYNITAGKHQRSLKSFVSWLQCVPAPVLFQAHFLPTEYLESLPQQAILD